MAAIALLVLLQVATPEPIRVTEDGAVLDLTGRELRGVNADGSPDKFEGIGLIVEGRKKVTIRGGRLRGFKCAVLVRDCENVVLEGIDVSGNFRQRLGSTPEREDSSDWLRPHENDEQQWRKRYGAGICIENSNRVTIRDCVGRHQQNGIILDRCKDCEVYDNDMSFNSGWGLAMWRSSGNRICSNSFDWCVRGYSHGVYDRGQDSAGILVFEQCSDNSFLFNSATHGGDGFFLYAGNETLKRTGKGGCNDNFVHCNDFSHAVANAIEATFSRGNRFVKNACSDSNYGIWAGYSYETSIQFNGFRHNAIAGVAIEHGEDNTILANVFQDNPRGIQLWWDDDKDLLSSVFAKVRSCRSRGYTIGLNRFFGDRIGIHLRGTTGVVLGSNRFVGVASPVERHGNSEAAEGPVVGVELDVLQGVPGRRDPFLPADHPRGREHILIGEWGPLDPTLPGVFPLRVVGWGGCSFQVTGGKPFVVIGLPKGLDVEASARRFRVTAGKRAFTDFAALVQIGEKVYPFGGVLLNTSWRVRHWKWKSDPREDEAAWTALLGSEAASDRVVGSLDFHWKHGGPGGGVAGDGFATLAETTMELPAGSYEIRTVSDDGVRVTIDGKVVQEDWTHHGPKEHRTVLELGAGEHSIVVEHFELDGYAALSFDLRPAG